MFVSRKENKTSKGKADQQENRLPSGSTRRVFLLLLLLFFNYRQSPRIPMEPE